MPTKRKKADSKADPISKEMGRRIAEARRARGWTQADVAARSGWKIEDAEAGRAKGISPSALGNYEQGTRRLSNEVAEILAAVFDMPAAYFMVVIDEREAEVIIAMRRRPDLPTSQPRDRRQHR